MDWLVQSVILAEIIDSHFLICMLNSIKIGCEKPNLAKIATAKSCQTAIATASN